MQPGCRSPLRAVLVVALVAAGATALTATTARADHRLLHERPEQPAVARFPAGFDAPADSEWGFGIGGFGGALDDDDAWGVDLSGPFADHDPVIFVHGNVVDHADWYPVRDRFVAAGWDPADLWALSYNGLGNGSGSAAGTANPRRDEEHAAAGGDGMPRSTSNDANTTDVAAFVDAVLAHTGSERFSLVTHSLGVTLARRTLELRPDLAQRLVAFVGIAGGNHGTSLCPPGTEGLLVSCDEVAAGSPWLVALNADADELGTAEVMTVYDGTGVSDIAYVGPTYAHSPRLGDIVERAVDCTYGRGHNDLRLSPALVDAYRLFVEAAERSERGDCGPAALPLSPAEPLPPPASTAG